MEANSDPENHSEIPIEKPVVDNNFEDNQSVSEEKNPNDKPFSEVRSIKPASNEKDLSIKENELQESKLTRKDSKNRKKSKEEIIVDEALNDRKKMSFAALKKWDNQRNQFLNTQRNHLENILVRIDKKIEFSSLSTQKLIKFFKEKAARELDHIHYIQNKLSKISDVYSEILPGVKGKSIEQRTDFFPVLTKSLNKIDDFHVKQLKEAQRKSEFIEQKILKDGLNKWISEYGKKLIQIKEKITLVKKILNKVNIETAEKNTKYSKLFHNMIEFPNKTTTKTRDLYQSQLFFLKLANQQTSLHRDLGRELLNYWKEVLILESSNLKQVRTLFLDLILNCEIKDEETTEILKSFQEFDPVKEIEDYYSIEKVLSADEYSFIAKYNNTEKVTLNELKHYLEEFDLIPLKDKSLILKEIAVERDCGSISKIWKSCALAFTVDKNLLIFDDNKDFEPANSCAKIENLTVKDRKDGDMEIIQKVPGIIFNSNKEFIIRSSNKDCLEEIREYINFENHKKN